MSLYSRFRAVVFVLCALAGLGFASTGAQAASGRIAFEVIKGGWFIGGQGGRGVLVFKGRRYPITIGGLSAGLVFGGSLTRFQGIVSNIRSPYDVTGVYGAVGAGGAALVGAQVLTMRNGKGALLQVRGEQIGLQLNLDLSGLAISIP